MLLASEISDIAGGRSWLLSRALLAAEKHGKDVVMLVDDDMDFSLAHAETLVAAVRDTGYPCSAIYPTETGAFAGRRWCPFRYLVGLGFCALPTTLLRSTAERLKQVEYGENREPIWPFAPSGPNYAQGCWMAEDYSFSALLGGFYLLPMSVGHIKPVPLTADGETIERLTNWRDDVAPAPPGGWPADKE
jgi:hypothetical protein